VTSRRLLLACALVSAFLAATATTIAAFLWAIFAAIEPHVGMPAAASVVALAPAVFLAVAVLVFAAFARSRRGDGSHEEAAPFWARIWTGIKARPMAMSGLTVLALGLALLNPRYLGAILRAYLHEERGARP
jgi:membrane protease YdiL (CAAX protease family)